MKVYRVASIDMMGYEKEYGLYADYKEAKKRYRKEANGFKLRNCENNEEFACALDEMGIKNPKATTNDKYLNYVSIPYCYKTSYEYNEYDFATEEFYVAEIEVITND